MKLNNLQGIKEFITETFHKNSDIIFREVQIPSEIAAMLAYMDGICDKDIIERHIIFPLNTGEGLNGTFGNNFPDYIIKHCITANETKITVDEQEIINAIASGDTVLFFEGCDSAIIVGTKQYSIRAITEPPTQTVIRGPREGFIEDFKTNVSLLRRKLKTPEFVVETMTVGRLTSSVVAICYLDNVADKKILEKIKKRLGEIDIDGILDSSYVARFLEEKKYSIFKQNGYSEKPDVIAARILEGRIALIVDGSPMVITIPYLIVEDFQTPDDYFDKNIRITFLRLIRLLSVMISVLVPGVYVAAQMYHYELIPLSFLVNIINATKGIPFTPFTEMLFTIILFEILNQASVRMPRYMGMALSVVGALILGETAVKAGLLGSPTVMISALSGITLYIVPDLEPVFSLLRITFIILGGLLGIYAITFGCVALVAYMEGLDSYGAPILAPFSPYIKADMKDGLFKKPVTEFYTRPQSLSVKNKRRMKHESNNK